jgi:hypothetical protein
VTDWGSPFLRPDRWATILPTGVYGGGVRAPGTTTMTALARRLCRLEQDYNARLPEEIMHLVQTLKAEGMTDEELFALIPHASTEEVS